MNLQIEDLGLLAFLLYLAQQVAVRVDGKLDTRGRFAWSSTAGLAVDLEQLRLVQLRLFGVGVAKSDLATVQLFDLAGLRVHMGDRSVELRGLSLKNPVVAVTRDERGLVNLASWLRRTTPEAPSAQADRGPGWAAKIDEFRVAAGLFDLTDQSHAGQPVRLRLDVVSLVSRGLSWPMKSGQAPASAELEATLAAIGQHRDQRGRAKWRGRLHAVPGEVSGRLSLEQLPLGWLDAYLAPHSPWQFNDAVLQWRGETGARSGPYGWRVQLSGDAAVNSLRLA